MPRADAVEKVNGEAKFTSDIQIPGMLFAKYLRSPYPHARIKKIDTTAAEALPGVKCVLTHKNVPKVHPVPQMPGGKFEYLLDETVHGCGEEVAAIAAVTPQAAEKALKLIDVEYEVLPAVIDKEEKTIIREGEGINIIGGEKLTEPKRYRWTKQLNWNMNPEIGDVQDRTDLNQAYSDLLDQDYD